MKNLKERFPRLWELGERYFVFFNRAGAEEAPDAQGYNFSFFVEYELPRETNFGFRPGFRGYEKFSDYDDYKRAEQRAKTQLETYARRLIAKVAQRAATEALKQTKEIYWDREGGEFDQIVYRIVAPIVERIDARKDHVARRGVKQSKQKRELATA